MSYQILYGKVMIEIKALADNSVDAIVTDPPYEIGFMGRAWDNSGVAYDVAMWKECLRVLKPGGHLLSFGGSRTYHRMACAVEDAGFEIRDQIQWIFGSGFPKSMNVSKAIDRAAGLEQEVVGIDASSHRPNAERNHVNGQVGSFGFKGEGSSLITAPTTDSAKQWDGWGTALKPAHEPIVLARKPLIGTVVANVLIHGTGALNIAACRIPGEPVPINKLEAWSGFGQEIAPEYTATMSDVGRWPSNLIHDGSDEVLEEFSKAGESSSAIRSTNGVGEPLDPSEDNWRFKRVAGGYIDEGSAARFFYCAKADREDRNEGCDEFDKKALNWSSGTQSPGTFQAEGTDRSSRNNHPTVKPTDLMRYLCKMITPPGGTVLDPFMGSGSTGKAALYEGFHFIGIEKDANYCEIAKARMEYVLATDVPLLRAIAKEERIAEVPQVTQKIFNF